tara:strand:+ start:403 stop:564 length:162 start_codon:yes stop_codon:yes gene_type:complete
MLVLLAAQILALSDNEVNQKIKAFRQNIHDEVNKKNELLKTKGIKNFLGKNSS